MLDFSYTKQPDEQEMVRIDFTNRIDSFVISGYAISAATVVIYDALGTNVSSTMLVTDSTSYSGNYVYFGVKAGTSGSTYYAKITATVTKAGSTTQTIEEDLSIYIAQEGAA